MRRTIPGQLLTAIVGLSLLPCSPRAGSAAGPPTIGFVYNGPANFDSSTWVERSCSSPFNICFEINLYALDGVTRLGTAHFALSCLDVDPFPAYLPSALRCDPPTP